MNNLDNFEKIIKDKLENYEFPVDKNQWDLLQKKLPKKKKMNMNYITIPLMIILLSLFPTNNTITHSTKIYHKNTHLIENQLDTISILSNDKYISTNDAVSDATNDAVSDAVITRKHDKEIVKLPSRTVEQIIPTIIEKDIIKRIEEKEKIMIVSNDTIQKDTIKQQYNLPPRIFFPTAFTPNSDGDNDEFFPVGEIDLYPFDMLIYDRWGQLVFETMNINNKWTGNNCEQGLYVYIFRIQLDNGEWITKKGKIQLIK